MKGQKSGQSGEETVSVLDQFESVGLSKVYAGELNAKKSQFRKSENSKSNLKDSFK